MVALIPMAKESPDDERESSVPPQTPRPESGKPNTETTHALVLRAKAGDPAALDELCARYLPRLRRWAHGRLPAWSRSALDTDDLVQETLTRVARRIESFDPRHEAAFQWYLRRALANRIRDEVDRAKGKSVETLESGKPSPGPSPLEELIGTDLLERYEAALLKLKSEDRNAIIARVEMEMTWSEVAEALGKNSSESAQMTVKRALVRLAREMSLGSKK